MTDKLIEFLTELAVDAEMQEAYKQEPRKLMESKGLQEEDILLLLSKDTDAIRKRLGEDYSIGVLDIITAIKKK